MKLLLHIIGWLMRLLEKTNVLNDDVILLHWCHHYIAQGLSIPPYIGMDAVPTVTTNPVTNIAETSFTANGEITLNPNSSNPTEWGFVYNPSVNGTPQLGPSDVVFATGEFTGTTFDMPVTGLTASTEYNVRAYAINGAGTAYGDTVTVTTSSPPATDFSGGSGVSVNVSPSGSGSPATSGGSGVIIGVSAAGGGQGSALVFPTIRSFNSGDMGVEATAVTVVLPEGHTEDDLLIIGVSRDGGQTMTAPEGWIKIGALTTHAVNRHDVWYKVRGVTESDPEITWPSALEEGTWYSIAITAGTWSGTPEIAGAAGNDTNPDAPSLTPSWGAANTLWFALHGWDFNRSSSTNPTDYTLLTYQQGSNVVSAGHRTHYREINAASQDPSAITISNTDTWYAYTLAVQPSATSTDFSGGSASSVNITAQGSGQPDVSGGSGIDINVSASGSGQPDVAQGSDSAVNIASDGMGSPAVSNGSSSDVEITAVGAGSAEQTLEFSGGSSVQVNVTTSGVGSPAFAEGNSDSLDITTQGAGTPAVEAGSNSQVDVTSQGSGSVDISDGSFADVVITPSGDGSPDVEGGSSTTITITAAGAGIAQFEGAFAGGSGTSVEITTGGSGTPAISSGASAQVNVQPEGSGNPDIANGSDTSVNITAAGDGTSEEPSDFVGGSSTIVHITAAGAGESDQIQIPYPEISDEEWELMAETIKLITRRKVVSGIPTLKLHEGTNLEQDFLWLDKNEEPMDLATWGAEFGVKLRKRDDNYIIYASSYNSDAYITVEPDGEKGLIRLNVPYHEFYDLNMVWGVWDLVMVPDTSMPTVRRLKILDGAAVYIQRVIDVEDPLVTLLLDDLGAELWDNNSQPLVF